MLRRCRCDDDDATLLEEGRGVESEGEGRDGVDTEGRGGVTGEERKEGEGGEGRTGEAGSEGIPPRKQMRDTLIGEGSCISSTKLIKSSKEESTRFEKNPDAAIN